ncbi:MAG TPA: bifunctional DNA-formamidopyrimidine glycosylase/DNA-(apurinic or apyrimidinic site) lyase [Trebonia sp.]|jgi:formamidopyrimidine-DNA glycosylase|nr:bifunctional DNA-formamidopyrimidine glycosylase/DNA-(apurinic or apyrimidinic site) lyase [Trebonia sp.]
MPELPEVETVRAGLERHVLGRPIASAAVLNPRAVRRDPAGPAGFAAAMTGRTLTRAERRGKYLWFALSDRPGGRPPVPPDVHAVGPDRKGRDLIRPDHTDDGPADEPDEALLAHLGMSGQLLVGEPGRPLSPHVRARFTFTDGGPDLRFTDQRTFGHLMLTQLVPTIDATPGDPATGRLGIVPEPISHIAPDPLEAAFDPAVFAARLARRKTGIKRALLDQSLISGIGNIYADEALWRAKLHWARPTETLRKAEVSRLLEAVNDVLTEALKAGGTSFDAQYVNVNGESGYFDIALNAYGREGEPCARCGTPIRRDAFMNRSAHSCPRCQPRPRNGHW